jgi:hypothetical protein
MLAPPDLYHIYYGDYTSEVGQNTMQLVDYFAQHLGESDWWKIVTSYYQTVAGVTSYVSSGPFNLKKSINVATTQLSGSLVQADAVNSITAAINRGDFVADTNAFYVIIFAGYFEFTLDTGTKFIDYWCGFHTRFDYFPPGSKTSISLKYFVVGDPSSAPANWVSCAMHGPDASANGNWGADSIVTVYAHEAVETVTDYMGAWKYIHPGTVSNGFEAADLCVWTFGEMLTNNTNIQVGDLTWMVQRLWVPKYGCFLQLP